MMNLEGIAAELFTIYCISRLCIRKWRKGQLLAVMTSLYTTSQLAPPSSTPRVNVCQLLPLFRKYSKIIFDENCRGKVTQFVLSQTLICCGCLLQTRSAHHQSKFLWPSQTQTELIPRLVSLLWHSAQTVAI